MNVIDDEPRLLRPINYPAGTPGAGAGVFKTRDGRRVMIVHPMGRLFMDPLDDPFAAVRDALDGHRLGGGVDAILVDIHAEATSEKMAMGHWLDGRVSLVAGTHSHVPTADAQVLEKGTAYITDMGMWRLRLGHWHEEGKRDRTLCKKDSGGRLEPAEGEATVCGVYLETDDGTGLAVAVSSASRGRTARGAVAAIEHEDMTGRGSVRTRAPRFHGPNIVTVPPWSRSLLSPPPGQLLSIATAPDRRPGASAVWSAILLSALGLAGAMVYETIALSLAGFYYPTT